MIGFDPLTVSTLLVLASGSADVCMRHDPAKINIIPRTEEVEYDTSQSLAELQEYQTDTVDPYSFHGSTVTQAFTRGRIKVEQAIKLGHSQNRKGDQSCLWYDTIEITLHIEPTIVVAREIYNDTCMRDAVIDHELKHVRVDREIVNKYANVMGQKLLSELQSRGFSAGPLPSDRVEDVSEKMQRVVKQILELETQKMSVDRQERQREVDSLGEYESVDARCPAFEKKKQKLYGNLGR